MSARGDRPEDVELGARLRSALHQDAEASRQVDVDRVWAEVAARVPARRRRRALQRASVAAVLAVVVVAGTVGGVLGLQALQTRTAPPPASSGPPAVVSVDQLLPPPRRTPRATTGSTTPDGAASWAVPGQCPAPTVGAAEVVTARDGAGSFGATIDVTQVARYADRDTARAALQALLDAVEECAADRPGLHSTALGDGLEGVLVTTGGDDGGSEAVTALVLAGGAVALVTTTGPDAGGAGAREQVLDRAGAFSRAGSSDSPPDGSRDSSSDSTDGGRR